MKKRSIFTKGGAVLAASALVMCMGVGSAFAAGQTTGTTSSETSWSAPTSAMNNVIVKDGKLYKVLTNWSNAWASAGSDYLGISNSAWLAGSGGGDFETAVDTMNTTLGGVWATSANESPNAYQWNYFYNMYAEEGEESDTSCVSAAFDITDGVYAPLKYRPEVIWYSNSFAKGESGASAVEAQVNAVKSLSYATSQTETGKDSHNGQPVYTATYTTYDSVDAATEAGYYRYNDENYNPYTVVAGNGAPLSWVRSLNTAGHYAENVISDTANYTSSVTEETVNYKNMNELPRSNRYNETPVQCAVNVEKAVKGSVYYTLSQIAAGNVTKKNVAYVTDNSLTNSTPTVTVVAWDYTDQVGDSSTKLMNGTSGVSPLTVNQLTTNTVKAQRVANLNSGGANLSSASYGQVTQALPYTLYTATADELLSQDYIYAPNAATAAQWQSWLETNASEEAYARYTSGACQIITTTPAVMQMSNFTAEKLVWSIYAINSFYPELFKNMSLISYWYDNVYHINSDQVATVVNWGCANATITTGNELSGLSSYSKTAMEAKFQTGLEYYEAIANGATDTEGTIRRVLDGKDLDGGTDPGSTSGSSLQGGSTLSTEAGPWAFADFEPSSDWVAGTEASVYLSSTPVDSGAKATMVANVSGFAPTTYTFQKSTDGVTWTTKATKTVGTYAVTAGNGIQWRVIATDGTNTVTSAAFTPATVAPSAKLSAAAVVAGSKTTLKAMVTGFAAKSYTFQKSTDGVTWTTKATKSTGAYTVTAGNGVQWRVIATDGTNTVTSDAFTPSTIAPAVSLSSTAVASGAKTTITASATDFTPTKFTFQKSTDGVTWTTKTTKTVGTYTVTAGNGVQWRVIATDGTYTATSEAYTPAVAE